MFEQYHGLGRIFIHLVPESPSAELGFQLCYELLKFRKPMLIEKLLQLDIDAGRTALEKLADTNWLMFISDLLSNQKLSQTINNRTKEILSKYSS
jgi:hypothetical protein